MNKKFTKLIAALALLVFMTPTMAGWGQVVSGTEYSTVSANALPEDWSYSGTFASGSSTDANYFKLFPSSNYMQTGNFLQNGITSVKINARTYGGTTGDHTVITITWYDATTSNSTVLGTITANNKSLTDFTLSSFTNTPTANTNGYIRFHCANADGSHGCGLAKVTITYTAGTTNPTYSLTDESGENGSISFSASPVEAGTHVTLTPTPASAAYYFVENSWSFFDEGLVNVTENIEFVQGEANTIVMPAYNLLVDATFAAKPTFAITCVNDAHGLLTASPTPAYEGQTVTLSYIPETGYRLASIVITKTSDGSATGITPTASGDDFTFEMPGYAVTATATFEEIPTHTITFNAGTGSCITPTITDFEGSSITLPTAEPSYGCGQAGWTFIGWATAEITETTTAPATLTGSYTIIDDATLYAVYKDVVIGSVNTSNVFLNGSFNNNIITWTASGIVSIKQEKGSGSSAPSSSYVSAPRWYTSNKITITPSVSINSITVTATSETYATALANSTYTNATASVDGTKVTITPTNGSNAITIVMAGQSRLSSLIVNYATSTTYYNTAPDCVIQRTLTLPSNAQVLLFDGEENPIAFENGTALIGEGTEVRVSIDRINDCQLFESLSVTPTTGTVEVTELEPEVYYSFTMPTCDATLVISTTTADEYTLSVVKPEQVSFEKLKVGWEGEVLPTEIPASICEQAFVVVKNLTVSSGYLLNSVTLTYGDETIEVSKNGEDYGFVMPASNATLTFEVREAATYTLVTSTNDLVPGKHYIIASSKTAGAAKGMSNDRGNNRRSVDVAISNNSNVFTVTEVKDLYEFAISGDAGNWTIYDKNEKALNENNTYGYLHSSSGNSNYLKTSTSIAQAGDNGYWTIAFGDEGNAIITAKAGTNNTIRYNGNNGSLLFSCYAESSQSPVYLYMKDEDYNLEFYSPTTLSALPTDNGEIYTVQNGSILTYTGTNTNPANLIVKDGGQLKVYPSGAKDGDEVQATVEKNIDAWTAGSTGGWYFIASPINDNYLNPSTVENMLPADEGSGENIIRNYDLYWLEDVDPIPMWRNYRKNSFNLANGQGYLYARSEAATLEFAGAVKPYDANHTIPVFEGWNLIGNPYTFNAYPDVAYYTINDANTGITAATATSSAAVAPCTGIIVKATSNGNVKFLEAAPVGSANQGNIEMTLAQQVTNRGNATTLDNAIVSFNVGDELEKFYFGEQNANLYIPQGTEEYAIVSSNGQGTMPVNFRANENGTYTLTVNPENVEMNYLHLIDNMTGTDIDLLQTPSYSFNAKVTDYESRFKLVFAAANQNGEEGNDNFAFFSNGQYIIANEGQATLQVIDITGRILSSETINGSVSKSINAPVGVYMLRLINGENVKVQKIVVR